MSFLAKHGGRYGTIIMSAYHCVQEAMVPQDASSIVNWIKGSIEFKWWWNACIWSNGRADSVIHVSLPEQWLVGAGGKCSYFYVLHH